MLPIETGKALALSTTLPAHFNLKLHVCSSVVQRVRQDDLDHSWRWQRNNFIPVLYKDASFVIQSLHSLCDLQCSDIDTLAGKMLRHLIVLVFVLAALMCAYAQTTVAPSATRAPVCRKGEVYRKCGNGCTEPRCARRRPFCKPMCTAGCFCAPGYARNARNVCIPLNMCVYTNFDS
ncbi:uncharacterized protein LOC118510163 [Anopheles stephensi]|uniref:uncharacterized protein LOC118510163 n=1 Tax=Anopheles stephensi TaxID=30069 RepID=UPI0016587E5E|nr:uncharacterized protein LOC118510163 [Anopheles stephensi]